MSTLAKLRVDAIRAAGYLISVHNNGMHIVISTISGLVDYWPTTHKWVSRNDGAKGDDFLLLMLKLEELSGYVRPKAVNLPQEEKPKDWWSVYLDARKNALHALLAEGKSPAEMLQTLNLVDENHAMRILARTESNG